MNDDGDTDGEDDGKEVTNKWKKGQQGCNTNTDANTNNNKQESALSEENKSKKEKINTIRRMTIKTRTKTTKKGNQQ